MDRESIVFGGGCLIGFMLCVIICGTIAVVTDDTKEGGIKQTRQEAIEAGVAEWTVDAKTGETAFSWKGK